MMKRRWLFLSLVVVLALLPLVLASANQGFDLSWSTIDGGGGTFSTGGDYSLGGTVGQPDAGVLSGGVYTLAGGFWSGGAQVVTQHFISLPLVIRNH
jgi:hypothetical protein